MYSCASVRVRAHIKRKRKMQALLFVSSHASPDVKLCVVARMHVLACLRARICYKKKHCAGSKTIFHILHSDWNT